MFFTRRLYISHDLIFVFLFPVFYTFAILFLEILIVIQYFPFTETVCFFMAHFHSPDDMTV